MSAAEAVVSRLSGEHIVELLEEGSEAMHVASRLGSRPVGDGDGPRARLRLGSLAEGDARRHVALLRQRRRPARVRALELPYKASATWRESKAARSAAVRTKKTPALGKQKTPVRSADVRH